MIKRKTLQEQRIELHEFENITEKRNRVFKVSYTEQGGVVRFEKMFQRKKYVRDILNDPRYEKVKIYRGDVVYE